MGDSVCVDQFCVKLAACALLFALHALEWGYEQLHGSWYLLSQPGGDLQRAVLLLMETLVWVRLQAALVLKVRAASDSVR